jgi:hypothetical protein
MRRFIEWAFGPDRVFEVAKLVHQAQILTEALLETPQDETLRQTLALQLLELRNTADAHRWIEEGNIAAALVRLPRVPDEVRLVVHQLRSGLHALERLVRARLATAITLSLPAPHQAAIRRAA